MESNGSKAGGSGCFHGLDRLSVEVSICDLDTFSAANPQH